MARKNETRSVNMVEISARVNVIVPVEYLHCVLENIMELRDYGEADVTSIREVEDALEAVCRTSPAAAVEIQTWNHISNDRRRGSQR